MHEVFCVSAGQLDVKKDSNIINKKNMYLNYGLLGLASQIQAHGLSTLQLHGHFNHPTKFFEYCLGKGIDKTNYPVFISMPSFYALSWVKEFTRLLKTRTPIARIVLGGRWVVDGHPEKLNVLLPDVDDVIDGLADNKIIQLLQNDRSIHNTSVHQRLNYSILDKRHLFQPSIEVSRGCGMKCNFCQEGKEKLQPLKSPVQLTSEMNDILLKDDLMDMTPYFESSMFKPNQRWLQELIEQREIYSKHYLWRAESRVDSLSPKLIPYLAKAGLKVLDLGLESASHKQLISLGKSIKPDRYLERASILLNTAKEFGIEVKVNVLLYAGESAKTIQETYDWLDAHRGFIRGISVGPVIAFGWDEKKKEFINSMVSDGASIYKEKHSLIGVTHMNLSKEITHEKVLQISKDISRDFMSAEDFYFLKSFSYFPRDYDFKAFVSDAKSNCQSLSFSI